VPEGVPITEGLELLDEVDELGLLCLPGEVRFAILREALAYAQSRRAFLIVDPLVTKPDEAIDLARLLAERGSANAAVFFPPVVVPDPATGEAEPCPCGPAIAGLYARTDAARGVWKAAAGTQAVLMGSERLGVEIGQPEFDRLGPEAVNPLRVLPGSGPVVWGARTVHGADWLGSDWKYVPVRRLALLIERSLDAGTRWAVFEPNDEPLWSSLRADVGEFMHALFRDGAFPGTTPQDAYLVRCDRTTMTQDDLDGGRVVVLVGFAPLKPAEFVMLRIGIDAAPAPGTGQFGDGVRGQAPPSGVENVRARHRYGEGRSGAVGPGTVAGASHWWERLKAWVARLLGDEDRDAPEDRG
jgi:phage tail sheath protein FI